MDNDELKANIKAKRKELDSLKQRQEKLEREIKAYEDSRKPISFVKPDAKCHNGLILACQSDSLNYGQVNLYTVEEYKAGLAEDMYYPESKDAMPEKFGDKPAIVDESFYHTVVEYHPSLQSVEEEMRTGKLTDSVDDSMGGCTGGLRYDSYLECSSVAAKSEKPNELFYSFHISSGVVKKFGSDIPKKWKECAIIDKLPDISKQTSKPSKRRLPNVPDSSVENENQYE